MEELLIKTKNAQKELLRLSNKQRHILLDNIAKAIKENTSYILNENKKDIINASSSGLSSSMIERLTLNESRIEGLIKGVKDVNNLPDYVNEVIETITRDDGLIIKKVRVPFGVIAVIFESRPNVSVDIASLCLKTANACVLKGGKEAINTNIALVNIMKEAIKDIVDPNVITLINSTDRKDTDKLIVAKDYIDLLIPRGSKGLIQYVVNNAKVPFIETGAGNCHVYVHEKADFDMAMNIIINAKYQRPSVCNSIESLVIDKNIANEFLPILKMKFDELNIEIRGDELTTSIIDCFKASEEDYYKEYNDYIISIKVVDNYLKAIEHINKYSTKHSEAIITSDEEVAKIFFESIDSACVYHNASTRFTDGGEFTFGAEIGISTSKLHARGPMGLKEITTYKYVISGQGQIRK